MSHKPLVSIIIVSYNTSDLTQKCLGCAVSSTGFAPGELEIIVVDNNSTDDTIAQIKENYPHVKLISNPQNLGFGAGNNAGVSAARGEYVLLLNTDAFLKSESLRLLVDELSKHSEYLAVSPRLIDESGKTQQSAGYFPTPSRVSGWMLGLDKIPLVKLFFPSPYHLFEINKYRRDLTPDWLMGAVVLFRRAEYLAVNGFDADFFMYGEEVELFYRLKSRFPAKAPRLLSAVAVTHLGSVSTQQSNTSRLLSEFAGVIRFTQKHYPQQTHWVKLIIKFGVILRILAFSLLNYNRQTVPHYLSYLRQ